MNESFSVGSRKLLPFGKGKSALKAKNHNQTIRAVNALLNITIKQSEDDTGRAVYSDSGVSLVLPGSSSSTGGQSTGQLQTYRVKSKSGDTLTCRTWNGTTEGGIDVQVAVNRNSRQLSTETINGVTYSYGSYTDAGDGINSTRVSDDGTTEETQIVTPMWYLNCEIDAMATNYSGVGSVDLIEVSARCWAKVTEEL